MVLHYSNCDNCIHKNVCGMKDTFDDVVKDITVVVDRHKESNTPAKVSVSCSYHEMSKPTPRPGLN